MFYIFLMTSLLESGEAVGMKVLTLMLLMANLINTK